MPMADGQRGDGALLAQVRQPKAGRRRGERDDRYVYALRADVVDQLESFAFLHGALECRHSCCEALQRLRHDRGKRRGDVADPHVTDRAVVGSTGRHSRHLRPLEHPACLSQECGSGVGQRDLAARAIEQLQAEVLLELADLLADRRLGHVQLLRGTADVQLLLDRNEISELPKFHSPDPRPFRATSDASDVHRSSWSASGPESTPA
jgi:hypothetical protein